VLGLWSLTFGGAKTGNFWFDVVRNVLSILTGALILFSPLLATLLGLDRLFQDDRDDGSLDHLILSGLPLELVVLAKGIGHWLATGLPLVIGTPVFGLVLGLDARAIGLVALTLFIGTPALTLIGASGAAASLTSYPTASVVWTTPGMTLPNEFPDPIVDIDVVNGTFLLGTPTYNFNNAAPDDVRILAAVNVSALEAIRPATGYEGTSHTVEGLTDTLVITLESWRDPVNQAAMEAYAQDQLDSVKDAIIEGAVTVHDLYIPGLTFGLVVAGQMLLSLVLEHFNILVAQQSPINAMKVLGMALVVVGVIIIRKYQ